jgi:tyrosinase
MINEVIPQLPESMRKDWTDAASTFRLPYWDWAQKKYQKPKKKDEKGKFIYDVPFITKKPRVQVIDLKDGVTVVEIPNPMFKFTMPNNERMGCEGVCDVQDTWKKKIVTIPVSPVLFL